MQSIKLVCAGRLKEEFYIAACAEYEKRLSAFARVTVAQVREEKLPANPSPAQISAAMAAEADRIRRELPSSSVSVALCVEGRPIDSEGFADFIKKSSQSGPGLAFIIGGSNGLDEEFKKECALRLSMSKMTFPHHLARVMLLEQIYRAFSINAGARYHK